MLKAAVVILLIAAMIGVGWIVLYEDDDMTISMRVNRANLADSDTIPMNVDIKFESRLDEDILINNVRLEIYTEKGGQRVLKKMDGQFIIPANGEIIRNYDVVLENVDDVDDTV
ncbi:MAG: hypothetical protein KAX31_07780, partial [Thermoplasmata archaeon]|nr:hypothetical protein [Thermoplasmata archaeon]